MTSLDAVEIAALEKPTDSIMHQWAYSFMPSGKDIYLVGYCKGCRNSFTALLEKSTVPSKIVITHTEVPKFGCVGEYAGL